MGRFFRLIFNNIASLALAFLLAAIIWVTAVQESNPIVSREYLRPVEIVERPDGILLNQPQDRVQVRVEAPSNVLAQASANDFTAEINLNDLEFGQSDVPIRVRFDSSLNIDPDAISIFPASSRVNLDRRVTREVPVVVDVRGDVARTHSLGNIVADPQQVTITGPATRVNSIEEARATIFLNNTRETVIESARLLFYDNQGNTVSIASPDIQINTTRAAITAPVEERAGVADIAIQVQWRGRPRAGYRFLSAVASPRTVLVEGSPELIRELRAIPTEEIDINGLIEPDTFSVVLELPPGVTRLDSDPVYVDVEVERIMTTELFEPPPNVIGLGENLTATLVNTATSVVLFGPLEALETLRADDVRVDLDLFGLLTGTHAVEPNVSVPIQGVEVRSVQPSALSVVISSTLTQTITSSERLPEQLQQSVPQQPGRLLRVLQPPPVLIRRTWQNH